MRSDVFADDKLGDRVSPSSLFELRRGSLRFDPACQAVAGVASEGWWSQTGSNRRPHACKARALPAELWPRNQKTNACSRYDVLAFAQGLRRSSLRRRGLAGPKRRERRLGGLGALELPTSRLSSARSTQLSYKPLTRGASHAQAPATNAGCFSHSAALRQ